MDVLGNMAEGVEPGGLILDLLVIRQNPVIEAVTELLCEIDGEWLFAMGDAATAAVDSQIAAAGWSKGGGRPQRPRVLPNGADIVDASPARNARCYRRPCRACRRSESRARDHDCLVRRDLCAGTDVGNRRSYRQARADVDGQPMADPLRDLTPRRDTEVQPDNRDR